jgi:glycosyltransferase involved in cell wall biosynthesis
VVPARNEADVIAQAVTTLLQQNYPGAFHVVVVDDHSTDGTADAARAAALKLQCPERLTVISAKPLPAGWSGKVWAQSQGIAAVRSRRVPCDYLLLTDADIGHPAEAVTQLVARAEAEQRLCSSSRSCTRFRGSTIRAIAPRPRPAAACWCAARRSRKPAASNRSARS